MFDGSRVLTGPGTLYVAPLGTTEPTSVTGAWPSGWVELGYTDSGTAYSRQITVDDVEVEEEYYPVARVTTKIASNVSFSLAETTAQNLAIVLNAGLTPASTVQGTNPDGSIWTEEPPLGSEQRLMVGWDSRAQGDTTTPATSMLIIRKAVQDGQLQITMRKGNNKRLYSAQFTLEKPAGISPVRFIHPAALAA